MKKFMTLLSLAILLTLASVLADDSTNTQQFEVIQAHVAYQAAKIDVGMTTTISYIQSLGGDTSSLETIKSDFDTLSAQISTFTSLAGLRAGNAQMQNKVKEFRDAAKTLVDSNGGNIESLKTEIDTAVAADATVQALKDSSSSTAQSYVLDRFDAHFARLQAIYDRVSTRYGTSNPDEVANLQSLLDSISAERDSLSSAAGSGDLETVKTILSTVHDLNQQFIQAVKDLTAGTGTGSPIGAHTGAGKTANGEKVLSDMETSISELGALGYDTSSLQTIYAQAQTDYSDGQSSGDYTAFKADTQAFIDATKSLVGASNARVKKLEETQAGFDTAVRVGVATSTSGESNDSSA